MSDLIRRSELLTLIAAKLSDNKVTHRIRAVNRLIKSMPTVDAVEVVRCKDCRHNYEEFFGLVCVKGVCVDCIVSEDFYCAYGERKEVSE